MDSSSYSYLIRISHYPEQPAYEHAQMYQDVSLTKRPNYYDVILYTPTHSPPSSKPKGNDRVYREYGNNLEEYHR